MANIRMPGFVAVAALCACAGSARPTPPSISNLRFDHAAVPQDYGAIFGRFDFADEGGDVASADLALRDAQGVALSSWSSQVPREAVGLKAGTLVFQLALDGLRPGVYLLQVSLVDAKGARSQPQEAGFRLYGGFGRAAAYSSSNAGLGDTTIGDLDGDGRNDVVASAGGNLLVYHQTAAGTLGAEAVISTGISVSGIAVADVNGDGKKDLIVSGGQGVLQVYLQDALTGALQSPHVLQTGGIIAGALAVGDLNGNGRNDVVVLTDSGLSIFFQDASGALGAAVGYAVPVYLQGEVHIGDMDGDGKNDIVLQSGSKQIAVVRQTAPGVFGAPPDLYDLQTSYWPNIQSFALGDLNGDGRTDLAATDPGNGGSLNLLLQNGAGKLVPHVLMPGFDMPAGVKIADVDGDGLDDLLFDDGGKIVTVMHQSPDHSFVDKFIYSIPTLSFGGTLVHQALSVGDVNGDGLPDIVVTWSNEGVFLLPHL